MDLAVEGGLKPEGKEVTDCQAGSMHHSVHLTLLSRGKLAALWPAAQMRCWVLFSYMQEWCLPYLGLHYKKNQVFEINQKAKRDHSFIYTGQQAQNLHCPPGHHPELLFHPQNVSTASWLYKQEPVCCCPTLNSSFLSLTPLWPKWNFLSQQPCSPIWGLLQQSNNLSLFKLTIKLFSETEVFFQLSELFFWLFHDLPTSLCKRWLQGRAVSVWSPLPSSKSAFGWKPQHVQHGKVNIPVGALTSL